MNKIKNWIKLVKNITASHVFINNVINKDNKNKFTHIYQKNFHYREEGEKQYNS